ncbi:MAG: amidohydrolase [Chloroflexota bacterium]|nr:amidohydrolase [Chloroflexota bacterium]
MIIDAHTHIFPPSVRDRRANLLLTEPVFAEIYSDPQAKMATADDLLASMDRDGVERSVAVNFAWHDEALVDETNAYLLDAASRSGGRLIPFVSVYLAASAGHGRAEMEEAPASAKSDARSKIRALASAGARGIGELRPEQSGYNLANSDEADVLAWASSAFDLPLLVHASEPVGHAYPGKEGLPIAALYAFARSAPGVSIIAAHWGGGLPFYALMPEVRDALEMVWVDTSAGHLLYDPKIYRTMIDLIGVEKILWGSDFPLTTQANALERTQGAGLSDAELAAITGANAASLLGL